MKPLSTHLRKALVFLIVNRYSFIPPSWKKSNATFLSSMILSKPTNDEIELHENNRNISDLGGDWTNALTHLTLRHYWNESQPRNVPRKLSEPNTVEFRFCPFVCVFCGGGRAIDFPATSLEGSTCPSRSAFPARADQMSPV